MLATFEKSVVDVTTDTIEPIVLNHRWDRSAWDLANLYLLSVGAELLGKKAPRIVGLSEEMTCYVSPDYFAEDDPFADFIVHEDEAAHIFHNCKRRTIGLRETRRKEWLLEIEFGQRETFAYSCEAYACIVARAKGPAERSCLQTPPPQLRLRSPRVSGLTSFPALARPRAVPSRTVVCRWYAER